MNDFTKSCMCQHFDEKVYVERIENWGSISGRNGVITFHEVGKVDLCPTAKTGKGSGVRYSDCPQPWLSFFDSCFVHGV